MQHSGRQPVHVVILCLCARYQKYNSQDVIEDDAKIDSHDTTADRAGGERIWEYYLSCTPLRTNREGRPSQRVRRLYAPSARMTPAYLCERRDGGWAPPKARASRKLNQSHNSRAVYGLPLKWDLPHFRRASSHPLILFPVPHFANPVSLWEICY